LTPQHSSKQHSSEIFTFFSNISLSIIFCSILLWRVSFCSLSFIWVSIYSMSNYSVPFWEEDTALRYNCADVIQLRVILLSFVKHKIIVFSDTFLSVICKVSPLETLPLFSHTLSLTCFLSRQTLLTAKYNSVVILLSDTWHKFTVFHVIMSFY